MIAYSSRQLKYHEKNYSYHDMELVVVFLSNKIQRYNLYRLQQIFLPAIKFSSICLVERSEFFTRGDILKWLKDYDIKVLFHLGKFDLVAEALSRFSMGSLSSIAYEKKMFVKHFH